MCFPNIASTSCRNNLTMIAMFKTKYNNNCTEENIKAAMEFDTSIYLPNKTFINDIWEVVEPSEIIIKCFAFLPLVFWGIFGNTALIYVILKNRHLRSPTNLLICNMAVADLLSLLIHPWVFLIYDFFQNYQLGEFGCRAEGTIECALLLSSVMTLSAISYDRLTAIVLPRETRLTKYGAKIVMAVIWCIGSVLAGPMFYYRAYKEREWLDFTEKYCTEDLIVIKYYWHVLITMMVWLPLIIMTVCYVSIFIKLDRYERKLKQDPRSVIHVRYKSKVAKTMFIVVLTFSICHLPFTAMIFYRRQLVDNHKMSNTSVQNLVNGTYQTLWFTSKYLVFLNGAMNPVIYGLMNEKFRKVFLTMQVIRWIFYSDTQKTVKTPEKKKHTKETIIESNKNKIFSIFKSPFAHKNLNVAKEVTRSIPISEDNIKKISGYTNTNLKSRSPTSGVFTRSRN